MVDAVGTVLGSSEVGGIGDGIAPQPGGQSVGESLSAGSQLAAALKAGLRSIDLNQSITFRLYKKVILPFDGYVFWVKADLLSKSALINSFAPNTVDFNQIRRVLEGASSFDAQGSLHITTTNRQDPDESFSVNEVVFTSEQSVNDLNEIAPSTMWIAEIADFRFAFSQRRSFYKQANLFHYVGHAVYPVLESQIIDDVSGFDSRNVIVSNSLPLWLSLNKFMPMYPGFLVPDNQRPPYCAVDISDTRALQMAPLIDRRNNHWQLVTERVHLAVYGLRNFNALDFQDYILGQSLANNTFGIMNSPVFEDEKRTQTEISAIAMKKSIDLEINYYQATIRNLARQLILEAIPTFYIGGGVSAVSIH